MRPLSLAILNRVADLPLKSKGLIKLTQARATLADLGSRFGEFSWPLTLPATRTNARIFGVGALHPLALDKFRRTDYPFELRCDGEIFTGIFRLTSMRGGYTGNLIGAGASWATEIGDKKLTELNFAPVSYNGAQLEATLALDCDATDIQFPLLSFGNFYHPPVLTTQRDGSEEEQSRPASAVLDWPLSVDDYLPSVYYVNVLRQIFADIDWTLTGLVLDEPRWRETLITPAGATPDAAWPWGALLPATSTATVPELQESFFESGPDPFFTTAVGVDEQNQVRYFQPATPVLLQPGGTRAMEENRAGFLAPRAGVYAFAWEATISAISQFIDEQNNTDGADYAPHFAPVALGLVVFRGGEGYEGADGGLCTTGTGAFEPDQDRVLTPVRLDLPGSFALRTGTFSGTVNAFLEPGDAVRLLAFTCVQYQREGDGLNKYTRKGFTFTTTAVSFACTSYADNEGISKTMLKPADFLPPLGQRDVLRDFMLRTNTLALPDANRRTITLLTREELSAASGEAIDLSALIDPELIEYSPAAGAGVGSIVFASAANSSESLPGALLDTVRVAIGPGSGEQRIESLFAPVAARSYSLPQGIGLSARAELLTMSTADVLAQPLAEVETDVSSQAPRLVRFVGVTDALTVPFQSRRVPLARAVWSEQLRFDGAAGAVASYYARTMERLTRGHVAKAAPNLTPALYRQLTPGRKVIIASAEYTVESLSQFDIADEGNSTTIELIREL